MASGQQVNDKEASPNATPNPDAKTSLDDAKEDELAPTENHPQAQLWGVGEAAEAAKRQSKL